MFGGEFDDSAFMMEEVRRGGQRQCQVLRSISDAGQPFIRFVFEKDFLDGLRTVYAGKNSVYDILMSEKARAELKKVSRGNVQKMDTQNCQISVRMFTEENNRVYVADFKTMTVTFNGAKTASILGVMTNESTGEVEISVDFPLMTPSVVQAYLAGR